MEVDPDGVDITTDESRSGRPRFLLKAAASQLKLFSFINSLMQNIFFKRRNKIHLVSARGKYRRQLMINVTAQTSWKQNNDCQRCCFLKGEKKTPQKLF